MGKENKKSDKKGKKGNTVVKTAVRSATPASEVAEVTYSLERAAEVLGEPDGGLEEALRASHPDEVLRAEGIKVASERIITDGERLCSQALSILVSKEPDVLKAASSAGLSRGWLSLTVASLLRLRGQATQGQQHRKVSARQRASASASLDAAVAEGRRLRRLALERLPLVVRGQPDLEATLQQNRQSPVDVDALAGQLEGLASLILAVVQHKDTVVRTIALARQFSANEGEELRKSADAIRVAKDVKGPAGAARQREQQAVLDVLDGLCLLLLGEVFAPFAPLLSLRPRRAVLCFTACEAITSGLG
jgi:hypothetical protein